MQTSSPVAFIPDNAPFDETQRAWLNGFIAGLLGMERVLASVPGAPIAGSVPVAAPAEEDFPWHDPTLPLSERVQLAKGRPIAQRLMAAMGQLDCGQCGYQCQTYAAAIARGEESDLAKCVPGGRETAKALKQLASERGVIMIS